MTLVKGSRSTYQSRKTGGRKRATKIYVLLLANRPYSKSMWPKLTGNIRVKNFIFFKCVTHFDIKHLYDSML